MVRRGSIRQRYSAVVAAAAEEARGTRKRHRSDAHVGEHAGTYGPHAEELKRQWGNGQLTSAQVQLLSASAQASGSDGVSRIAAAGCSGKYGGNLFRDVKSAFGWPDGAPPIEYILVPTKSNGRKTPWPVLFPHRFFQEVFRKRPDTWSSRICPCEDACHEFWDSMKLSPFVQRHPFLNPSTWRQTVPIGFHGDGGAFNRNNSLYPLHWNSLIVSGPTIQTRFLFTIIQKSELCEDTIDELLRAFSWSVNVLLSGETPHLDWQRRPLTGGGSALAGGFRGCLTHIRGDWEFYRKIFYFPSWSANERMCPFCLASSEAGSDLLWTRVDSEAAWRRTCFTDESYREFIKGLGLELPILFSCVLGLRLECVTVDALHTLDQGVASHIIGSVFWYVAVIRNHFGGRNYDVRVGHLAKHLKEWYASNACAKASRIQGPLTKERIKESGKWAKLKAKAAATRQLASYALFLITHFGDGAHPVWGEHDRLAQALCQMLVEFYSILASESQFLTDATTRRLPEFSLMFTSLCVKLASVAHHKGVRIWKLTPKLHLLTHMIEEQMVYWGNARFWWTYQDEDLIGRLINIADRLHPSTLGVSVLCKWVHCVFDQLLVNIEDE